MSEDIIDVEITETGMIRSTTPTISASNHSNSAEFFRRVKALTGGPQTASKRNKALELLTHSHDQQKAGN